MDHSDNLGTGRGSMTTNDKHRYVSLNNQEITNADVVGFLKTLNLKRPIKVTLSNRRTHRRLGTCWPYERRINLYRHSSAVLIHEIAHIKERSIYGSTGHSKRFVMIVRGLTDSWIQYQKRGS